MLEPGGRLVVYVRPRLATTARCSRTRFGGAGFRPAIVTHVFSWRVRVFEGRGGIPVVVDTGAAVLTFVERSLIGHVGRNPFGSAVLGVAVKPAQASDRKWSLLRAAIAMIAACGFTPGASGSSDASLTRRFAVAPAPGRSCRRRCGRGSRRCARST